MPPAEAANRGPWGRPVHSETSAGEWPSGKAADSGSANRRFESSLPSQCDVSGDGAHLSRDIVPDFWAAGGCAEGLVVARGIEGEFTNESAVLVNHADVCACHEQRDASADVVDLVCRLLLEKKKRNR